MSTENQVEVQEQAVTDEVITLDELEAAQAAQAAQAAEVEQTAEVEAPTKRARARKHVNPNQDRYRKSDGVPSKAERTREVILRLRDTAEQKEIVDAIQAEIGFTRAMARHYYYANVRILEQRDGVAVDNAE